MKEHKTPHKEFARHAENPRGRVTDKSLNAAFASVSEDFSDLSPISEISYANRNEDITNFLLEEPSSVTLIACDLTPKRTTDTIGVAVSSTDSSKFNSVESEITVNFLRNAKTEILNSVPLRRRELMDAIIDADTNLNNSTEVDMLLEYGRRTEEWVRQKISNCSKDGLLFPSLYQLFGGKNPLLR
ncbi:hypothetical protein VNO78_29049 [Psophocarpus tetragonolobus]|uniref:Uncharacterized protein n=1 Tax=Psophocarpus tetragonolobus TaxID=3891 RepID=A0AAN9RU91_PSOTE